MSTFTDFNGPQTGASVSAIAKFATEYENMRKELATHANEELTNAEQDPHKVKSYIDAKVKTVSDKAISVDQAVKQLLKSLAGITKDQLPLTVNDIETYFKTKLDNKDLVTYAKALATRVAELEAELNTLSLIQFDNVPVGAGIRWYRDTLPEDGTYVWANGQTLYGVNQNFPELARVWELGSADNVKVPKEDHTIFKVRKADRKIQAIQHAYIEPASGEDDTTTALTNRLESIAGQLQVLTAAVAELQGD